MAVCADGQGVFLGAVWVGSGVDGAEEVCGAVADVGGCGDGHLVVCRFGVAGGGVGIDVAEE